MAPQSPSPRSPVRSLALGAAALGPLLLTPIWLPLAGASPWLWVGATAALIAFLGVFLLLLRRVRHETTPPD